MWMGVSPSAGKFRDSVFFLDPSFNSAPNLQNYYIVFHMVTPNRMARQVKLEKRTTVLISGRQESLNICPPPQS